MQKSTPAATNGEHPNEDEPAADSNNFVHDASPQVPAQIHANMNGSMPPQQVYVHGMDPNQVYAPNVAGLETQFQSLEIQQPGDGGMMNGQHQDHDHNPEGEENGDDNDEGEEGDDDPLKLFIGQVSKT